MASERFAQNTMKIWADTICAASCDRVASGAFFENCFTFGDVGSCQQRCYWDYSDTTGICRFNALNRIALLARFRHFSMEKHAGRDAEAQSSNAAA